MLDKKPTEKKIVVDLDLLQQAKIYIDYANGVDLSVITWYRKGQIVYVDKLEAEHWRFVGLSNLYFAEEFLFTKKSEKNTMTDIDRETCERVKKELKERINHDPHPLPSRTPTEAPVRSARRNWF